MNRRGVALLAVLFVLALALPAGLLAVARCRDLLLTTQRRVVGLQALRVGDGCLALGRAALARELQDGVPRQSVMSRATDTLELAPGLACTLRALPIRDRDSTTTGWDVVAVGIVGGGEWNGATERWIPVASRIATVRREVP